MADKVLQNLQKTYKLEMKLSEQDKNNQPSSTSIGLHEFSTLALAVKFHCCRKLSKI